MPRALEAAFRCQQSVIEAYGPLSLPLSWGGWLEIQAVVTGALPVQSQLALS